MFVCVLLMGSDARIRYIVREALDHVHAASEEKKILEFKLVWAKYLVSWIHSGPVFYAGIDITVSGTWHCNVRRCASTR